MGAHVIGGSASTALAERVSRELGNVPFGIPFVKRFPDGELYLRVGGRLEEEDVVLVQSTRTDQDLLELSLLEDAIREAGARRLFVVIPYFGYARQDRPFFPGEPVSARVLAHLAENLADAVVTVDVHSPHTLAAFQKPVFEASGVPAIARLLRERSVDLLVSPDKGGVERVKRMAQLLNLPWFSLDKKRIDSERVELSLPAEKPEIEGRNVVILDDVISTGGTIVEAARLLARQRAGSIAAACVHGLFLRDAFERIKAVSNALYSTDTLDNPAEKVSVAPDIAQILRRDCVPL